MSDPLKITEDDRDIIMGFAAQREATVTRARQEAERITNEAAAKGIAIINERQSAYAARLADRLGISAEDLSERYRVNLETLTVEKIT